MDREKLIAGIKTNCDISDAQFWGSYSICGLLMRLRELFRSEHSLAPWEAIPQGEIAEWIGRREKQWEALAEETLKQVEIDGTLYDPFDVDGANAALAPYGLYYGAGYGIFNKPAFFLALLKGVEELYDYRIHHTGKEFCRDISAPLAMLQGRCVVLRHEQVSVLLWEKFLELKGKRFGGLLDAAFASYGITKESPFSQELDAKMRTVSEDIAGLFLFHEIGEAYEDDHSEKWLSILGNAGDKWTELYLRGIKDLLADTSDMGSLKSIVDMRRKPLLSFYMALLSGTRRELFPEMIEAFRAFSDCGDWSLIEEARTRGYGKAHTMRASILSLDENNAPAIRRYLEAARENGWQPSL
ncbi:MAG TPA: hypothetical protein VMH06_04800 [Thermodesulfovibrionales bacterium]|nr:hypothetical protein [Thermodesulfovibrionales bacterium]